LTHHQVDGRDAVLFDGRQVLGQVAAGEDAAVHLRVQGLDAAVEHFREAGVVADFGDRQAGVAQQLGGAAGGQQLDAWAASSRANSSTPRLSETLIRAWVIFMKAGGLRWKSKNGVG
jgi:hypothetical protein